MILNGIDGAWGERDITVFIPMLSKNSILRGFGHAPLELDESCR
jgi:hypothetical protein